jgi:hypothetical protein
MERLSVQGFATDRTISDASKVAGVLAPHMLDPLDGLLSSPALLNK